MWIDRFNGIIIWGVRRTDVRGDVVAEIFSELKIGSVCVVWHSPVARR